LSPYLFDFLPLRDDANERAVEAFRQFFIRVYLCRSVVG